MENSQIAQTEAENGMHEKLASLRIPGHAKERLVLDSRIRQNIGFPSV
jgi:hypothetical protein